jgi:1,4-dihydroxy-2-naphthoyl-CoA hydrolase
MPVFDTFDQELADHMVAGAMDRAGGGGGGVPQYLGIRFTSITPGVAVAELEVTSELLNPFGAAHGATLAALVDHVLGSAVFPLVPRGTWPATLEFKLNYLAPARLGPLRATATVVSMSKRTAVVAVECENDGRSVGTALGTVSITPPKS